ncbi:MAG: hypothetical protein IKU14_07725 [Rhodocyclaceae bacterium]|nr:hypothetical protein [Rhodocyclaceae bacterium]
MKLTKIALGVALAAGTVGAQAAQILFFPHVVVSGTVTTIASVIDTSGAGAGQYNQHWVYAGKNMLPTETAEEFNAKPCGEVDLWLPTSPYDIQSVDLGGVISKAGDHGVLFNDPSVNNNWRAVMGTKSYELAKAFLASGGAVGTRGYLIVDDPTSTTLEGYALVFDYKTGSAWGYKAEAADDYASIDAHDVGTAFGAHVMPPKEVISRLMVTPVTPAAMDPTHADFGKLSVAVMPEAIGSGHIVDRDENPVSGPEAAEVVCVGTVDMWKLVSSGAQSFAPDGGWMQVVDAAGTLFTAAGGSVIYQLDFGGQGATTSTLNGVAYPGTWNNLMVVK